MTGRQRPTSRTRLTKQRRPALNPRALSARSSSDAPSQPESAVGCLIDTPTKPVCPSSGANGRGHDNHQYEDKGVRSMTRRLRAAKRLAALVACVGVVAFPVSSEAATRYPSKCTMTGTPGNDVLRGTSGVDYLCGRAGDDVLVGLRGADHLVGGLGDDLVRAGPGEDWVVGRPGWDVLRSGGGKDGLIDGGNGYDRLYGGPGDDDCLVAL